MSNFPSNPSYSYGADLKSYQVNVIQTQLNETVQHQLDHNQQINHHLTQNNQSIQRNIHISQQNYIQFCNMKDTDYTQLNSLLLNETQRVNWLEEQNQTLHQRVDKLAFDIRQSHQQMIELQSFVQAQNKQLNQMHTELFLQQENRTNPVTEPIGGQPLFSRAPLVFSTQPNLSHNNLPLSYLDDQEMIEIVSATSSKRSAALYPCDMAPPQKKSRIDNRPEKSHTNQLPLDLRDYSEYSDKPIILTNLVFPNLIPCIKGSRLLTCVEFQILLPKKKQTNQRDLISVKLKEAIQPFECYTQAVDKKDFIKIIIPAQTIKLQKTINYQCFADSRKTLDNYFIEVSIGEEKEVLPCHFTPREYFSKNVPSNSFIYNKEGMIRLYTLCSQLNYTAQEKEVGHFSNRNIQRIQYRFMGQPQ